MKLAGHPIDTDTKKVIRNFLRSWKNVFGLDEEEIKDILRNKSLKPIIEKMDANTVRKMLKDASYASIKNAPVDFLYELSNRQVGIHILTEKEAGNVLGCYGPFGSVVRKTAQKGFIKKFPLLKYWEDYSPFIGLNERLFLLKERLAKTIAHEFGHFSNAIIANSPRVKTDFLKLLFPIKDKQDKVLALYSDRLFSFYDPSRMLFWTKEYLNVEWNEIISAYHDLYNKGYAVGGRYAIDKSYEIMSTQFGWLFGDEKISIVWDTHFDEIVKKQFIVIQDLKHRDIKFLSKKFIQEMYNRNTREKFKRFLDIFKEDFITV